MSDQFIFFDNPSFIQVLQGQVGLTPNQVNTQYITSPSGVITNLTTTNLISNNLSINNDTIHIGNNAGTGSYAVNVGGSAGQTNQGEYAISIGFNAGNTNQGNYAIAIGNQSGNTNQPSESIILNATGSPLNASTSGFFVSPVAQNVTSNLMCYNTDTKEIVYQPGVWYDYTPSITGPEQTIVLGQAYGRYTVIGKTCIGNSFLNVTSITQFTGTDALEITLPVTPHSSYANELTGTSSIGAGSLTIKDSSIPPYPNRTVLLNPHPVGNNLPRCRLWYTADNLVSGNQTYLEDDYLPTTFGNNVSWNGYSGGVNIAFNFTYEMQ